MRNQAWQRNRTFRYTVSSLLGLLAANLLSYVLTGHWADLGVTLGMLGVIVVVTVLRLLVAYWENKDSREAVGAISEPAAKEAPHE